jgi:hypothetical protein
MKRRVADCAVPRQSDHIGDNQPVDALLFADAVHEAEPDLDQLTSRRSNKL